MSQPPSRTTKWLASGVVGCCAGVYTLWLYSTDLSGARVSDFDQPWLAAHAILGGLDPFVFVEGHHEFPLIYPLTSITLVLPLGLLPLTTACVLFAAAGAAVLTFGLLSRGWWTLALLGSYPFIKAVELGQWAPLLVGLALAGPSLLFGAALAGKPTIGIALFAARPSWRAATGAAVVLVASLLIMPDWIEPWAKAVRAGGSHLTLPIMRPFGLAFLVVLLRWQWPEARMLAAFAFLPSYPGVYEAVLLFLIPRRVAEAAVLISGSWATYFLWSTFLPPNGPIPHAEWPAIFWGTYLPMVVVVLRRPVAPPPREFDATPAGRQ